MNYRNMTKQAARLILAATVLATPARAGDGATSIAASVDSLDGVPEALHAFYVEKDGKFQLQVTGLPPSGDVARLSEALRKERADHGALKDRVKLLGDRRIEDVVTELDRIPELELAAEGKMDDDKINQIVETRIKTRLGPVERERDQLRGQLTEKDKKIEGFEAKERTRTIHDKVRAAGVKAKLLPEAIDDALLLADRVMEVEEGTDRVVTRDNVGVTPGIEPEAWFTDIQKTRPHWWGPSAGGGAGGQRGPGGDTTANPFTHDNWNLTKQGELIQQDRAKAEQLARLAGTTIGGPQPAARK
jgi:hypothetical protein